MNKTVEKSSIEESFDPLEQFLFGLFGEAGVVIKEYFRSSLEKGKELRVIDFDDTVWRRQTALDKLGEGAKLNRQEKGNIWLIAKYCGLFEKGGKFAGQEEQVVTDEIIDYVKKLSNKRVKKALRKFAREFYFQQENGLIENIGEVIGNTKDSVNLILTAGIPYLQELKLKYSKLLVGGYNDYEIVNKNPDKIKSLIIYVMKLGYVPNEIIVYEDKTEEFNKAGKFLAELFGTKVIVKKQKINENNISETVEQKEFPHENIGK